MRAPRHPPTCLFVVVLRQSEAKFGALLSGLMGFVCVFAAKLPCFKRKAAARPRLPHAVSDSKLVGVGVAAGVAPEDSFVMTDQPAAAQLGYRQPNFYKHAIRAGDNRLAAHPDELERPSLFSIDPEASRRARGRWKQAYGSRSIFPVEGMTQEQRVERSATSVISFMQKSSSKTKFGAAAAAAGGEGGAASAAPAGDEVTPFEPDSAPDAAPAAQASEAPPA